MKNSKENKREFNPYQIVWAILTPKKGVARKEDRKTSGEILLLGSHHKFIPIHAPNIDRLNAKLESLIGKLVKEYEVLIITDKQFGLAEKCDFYSVATTKQLSKTYTIK